MEVIKVRAPSALHAQRLVSSLAGSFSASLNGQGVSHEVDVRLDSATATKLVQLFDALGLWLSDGRVDACQIGFGDRDYTLLAAKAGEVNDPTQFLLERTIQLQTALDSRVLLEQAKGILAERHQITPDEAFDRIRQDARSKRIKIHDLAAEIVASPTHSSLRRPPQGL